MTFGFIASSAMQPLHDAPRLRPAAMIASTTSSSFSGVGTAIPCLALFELNQSAAQADEKHKAVWACAATGTPAVAFKQLFYSGTMLGEFTERLLMLKVAAAF